MDRLRQQSFRELAMTFGQAKGLPFAGLLPADLLSRTVGDDTGEIYTPAVTLGMFLSQVLSSDGSCADAVARLVAWRAENQQPPCSANSGAFCKARQKLDELQLATLVRETGTQLHDHAKPEWLWKGRGVTLVDGTTLTAADTPENQAEYPQPDSQKPGLGFPMIRVVALISLAVGTVRDWAVAAYSGKGTGEVSLLRRLISSLESGALLVGDAIYCTFAEIALLTRTWTSCCPNTTNVRPTFAVEFAWAIETTSSPGQSRRGVRLG